MNEQIGSGPGRCPLEFFVSLRPVRAAIELGAGVDVMHAALNAAHHANRHGRSDDRLAVALPGLHCRLGRARPGHEVVVFGSEAALGRLLALDGIATLRRRGLLVEPEVVRAFCEPGASGTAFLRDRSAARGSPGVLRRAHERAIRRGSAAPPTDRTEQIDPSMLALYFGPAVVHVRALQAKVTDQPLMVSTYGFSSPQAPALLPIDLDVP